MSKKAKYIAILRTKKPDSIDEYLHWLEDRVHALTHLRLLDQSDFVGKTIRMRDEYRYIIDGLNEEIGDLLSNQDSGINLEQETKSEIELSDDKILPSNRPRKPITRHGFVYLLKVIGREGLYKIGRTKNPLNRLRTFNVKLPFDVKYDHLIRTSDMYQLERRLHNKYHKKRQNGSEFFMLTEKDVEHIKSLEGDNQ